MTRVHILVLLAFIKGTVELQMSGPEHSGNDFNIFIPIKPTLYYGRTQRKISTTRDDDGGHLPIVMLTVPIDGEELVLDLKLNEDLVPDNYTLQYHEGEKTVTYKPKKEELDLCHYHGSVRGKSNSWAAVSTCHGISGVIFDGIKQRYIEPALDDTTIKHFLYDHDDLNMTHLYGNQAINNNHVHLEKTTTHGQESKQESKQNRTKRHIKTNSRVRYIPKKTRYVELVLVADYYISQLMGGKWAVQSFMINLVNIVNSIYSPLNIKIALVGVVIWNNGNMIVLDEDSDTTLHDFVDYRENNLHYMYRHDHAQLLTGMTFSDYIIGLSHADVICQEPKLSASITSYFSPVLGRLAANSAHELGHSLGIIDHDEETCFCLHGKCVMNESNTGYFQWSSCSVRDLVHSFAEGNHNCLLNKPKRSYNYLKFV